MKRPSDAAKATSSTMAPWWSTPGSTPAGRHETSSSSASLRAPSTSGGARSTAPWRRDRYESLKRRLLAYLQGGELFVQDTFAGADPEYRFPIRAITERAWHSLFARNLFILPTADELRSHNPKLTIIYAPGFQTSPEIDGTNSGAAIVLNLGKGEVLIAGTSYAGEMKKSVFSTLNYLLPLSGVLPMHCSANVGPGGDVAIFFGLSGTGKTTLSTTSDRTLIGDDEHGWSDRGVFNFEGGCYAKIINLSPEAEPEIYATTRRFGTVLENVTFDAATRRLDLSDGSLTENTRGAYPINFMPNASSTGVAGHPNNVILLTADAFGVMPPVAKLTLDQAVYYFLSGYTAKVAGTERGIVEPEATFSPCFGAPFMAHHPSVYGDMLRDKMENHGAQAWLVNTGWTGRALRRWSPDQDRSHQGAAAGRSLRRPGRCRDGDRSGVRAPGPEKLSRRAPGGALATKHLGRQGRVRPSGPKAGPDVRR